MVKGKEKGKRLLTRENMIVCTLLGILLLVMAIPVEEKKETGKEEQSVLLDRERVIVDQPEVTAWEDENGLEQRLAEFLSCMEGAGEVRVMITFAASEEQVVEKDLSAAGLQEQDGSGGMPGNEKTVFMTDTGGSSVPYVRKTLAARVEGVTVLAQGGDSYEIQSRITGMIQALFGIEAHKIRVAKMK